MHDWKASETHRLLQPCVEVDVGDQNRVADITSIGLRVYPLRKIYDNFFIVKSNSKKHALLLISKSWHKGSFSLIISKLQIC